MVDTHQAQTHEAKTHEAPSAREARVVARMGLWAVIAAAALVSAAAVVIFLHRPHTPQLTPGQKQASPVVALLGGRLS